MYVCPSAWNSSAAAGRIYMKFDVLDVFDRVVCDLMENKCCRAGQTKHDSTAHALGMLNN
jgi:hypothetical protein